MTRPRLAHTGGEVDIVADFPSRPHFTLIHGGRCCIENDGRKPTPSVAGEVSGRPIDMYALRRAFPERWGHFLRTHFRNATDVALFFSTDEKTARNWLEGKHAPAGAFVARAIEAFPASVQCLVMGSC